MTTAKNYLTLVNDAVRESGAELDSLSSSTFSSPTNKDHIRFKEWIKQAWLEEQIERKLNYATTSRASIEIRPRVAVEQDASGTATVVSGDQITGSITDSVGLVYYVELISGAWASGTAKAQLDFNQDGLSINYQIYEPLEVNAPGDSSKIFTSDYPSWNFFSIAAANAANSTAISNVLGIDNDSFYMKEFASAGSDVDKLIDSTDQGSVFKVHYIPWDTFVESFNVNTIDYGTPRYISRMPNGRYTMFPVPAFGYILGFNYQNTPQELSSYSDTLTNMRTEYQDIVVWRAVMAYAEFDRKKEVYARAKRRYLFYKKQWDDNMINDISWAPSPYFSRSY